jgi:hypothetical protein
MRFTGLAPDLRADVEELSLASPSSPPAGEAQGSRRV